MDWSPDHYEMMLGRALTDDECNILRNVRLENEMNNKIRQLNEILKKKNLRIPILTENDGNCLFNSLLYHGLGKNLDELKRCIANLMMFYKDKKQFIPDQNATLAELFQIGNEIEFVYCRNKKKLFKYTYDAMCIDLLGDDGWRRCNTELLLIALSIALNLKITIYHNNGHITEVYHRQFDNTKPIFLAQIDEHHYLPVDSDSDTNAEHHKCPKYTDARIQYKMWHNNLLDAK